VSIDFTPHAVYDIDDAAERLETRRGGAGARFRRDLQELFVRLERLPQSAEEYEPPSPRFPGLRVAQLSRFKHYAVYYQPTADGILVVRCLHGSRNISAIFGDQ
jgi:plasmid stabilization system protein ParE